MSTSSTPTPASTPTRDNIRAKIFAKKELKSKILTFFDTEIELRQPKLRDILAAQQELKEQGEDGVSSTVASILLQYAYIPGTSEKIFEDADKAAILELPFDENMTRVTNALQEITDINFTPQKDDSKKGQTSTS
jgi:hypothetical protein